ncbi:HTH-type transcriptional regulator SgrR [Salmonella enterica subsp. enterica serovar Choleraesuis]|nr:HTH-type transcriptional regulator SgrR [Salmonella enterica subsp. enterica serovar Choleraesuis]
MSSARLQQQFIRLWQYCDGKPTDTTLELLAGELCCSRRHMRSLLNAMQQQGWIEWQAQVGRGKRSRLNFVRSGPDLQRQRASMLLEQGRIDRVADMLGDEQALRQMIVSHLGRSFRQGRHILRVLYYRPLQNLLPGSALRRSETHIARQIFSGLTKINEENGEVEADIAHHWQAITDLHWRFFLRPGIRFHHGRDLDMQDVISSLTRINHQALYANIIRIDSPTPWTLDIYLQQPDAWLPWLLGQVSAMILPQEWREMDDFSRKPVGTGPYAVAHNTTERLQIQAFDDYFGYRALIDEVDFWVLPDAAEDPLCGVQLQSDTHSPQAVESRLEEGCYYLLFDRRSRRGADPAVRQWLCQVLSPFNLIYRSQPQYQRYWFPALGLLPRWHHAPEATSTPRPEGLRQVILSFYGSHVEHQIIVRSMQTILAEHGVELIIQEVSYEEWYQGERNSDVWLNSANFTQPLDFSLFAHCFETPLIHRALKLDWQHDVTLWREKRLDLAAWCQQRVASQDMLPLIHHWLTIQGQRSLRGLRMNTLGWFDFKSAWFAPPEP